MRAQPVTEKVRKSLSRGSKMISQSLKKSSSKGKKSAAAVAGIALLGAGVATAIRLRRGKANGITTYHVAPGKEGWTITTGSNRRPMETFDTKRGAVEAARKIAKASSPSELVIHGSNGSATASHRYDAAPSRPARSRGHENGRVMNGRVKNGRGKDSRGKTDESEADHSRSS